MFAKLFLSQSMKRTVSAIWIVTSVFGSASVAEESTDISVKGHVHPMIPNNGLWPSMGEYLGNFNEANLAYPTEAPALMWNQGADLRVPLTKDNAGDYMQALKDFIEPDMRILVENHQAWNASKAGWYNMVYRGAGEPGNEKQPVLGREVIMNTNTGQIVPNTSWHEDYRPKPTWTQNYGVIYYNDVAAWTLGQVFENLKNPDVKQPQPEKMRFQDGSIVVKIEASTVQPEEWPWTDEDARHGSVLGDAASWSVYRPTTQNQKDWQNDDTVELTNVVQTVYPFQLAIKVRDSVASPETGWVYMGFVYDARSDGSGAWDRFVPAGMMWGNDPPENGAFVENPVIEESWINPDAPIFVRDTLGWQGRFAAPMDVAVRHNVKFIHIGASKEPVTIEDPPEDGFRVSSCLSCHGAAQTPYKDNLYPAPGGKFPPDGDEFFLFRPGSDAWNRWFQNRKGSEPMTQGFSQGRKIVALDYDLTSMFALEIAFGNEFAEDVLVGIMNGH